MADEPTEKQILNRNLEAIQADLGCAHINQVEGGYQFPLNDGKVVFMSTEAVQNYVAPDAKLDEDIQTEKTIEHDEEEHGNE